MTSNSYQEAYVWVWLPGEINPVVAGKLSKQADLLVFNYGKSYLDRDDKISLFTPELPLQTGNISPMAGLKIASCLRDAAPDAWGRRVLINRKFGTFKNDIDVSTLDELTYLLESGSDRIGALDFQLSPTEFIPRQSKNPTLIELMNSAELIEQGVPLSPELALALQHGTAIGGARPKSLIDTDGKKFIAKFSSSTDITNIVKAEYIAMKLAALSGINVAHVELKQAGGKDVLLVERFDRVYDDKNWKRKSMVSALTLFKLDEMMARYASYEDLCEIIRHSFTHSAQTLRELYARLCFNILSGNTDDHARNHAAFWDGKMLTLTPAYDICPQPRTGNESSQAMLITGQERGSRLQTCLNAAPQFHLSPEEAKKIVLNLIQSILENWDQVCSEAQISEVDKNLLRSRVFLNPYIFEGLREENKDIQRLGYQFADYL